MLAQGGAPCAGLGPVVAIAPRPDVIGGAADEAVHVEGLLLAGVARVGHVLYAQDRAVLECGVVLRALHDLDAAYRGSLRAVTRVRVVLYSTAYTRPSTSISAVSMPQRATAQRRVVSCRCG